MVDVAAQTGHPPTMTLDTYGLVIAELEGGEHRSAEQVIYDAREAAVRTVCERATEAATDGVPEILETPAFAGRSQKAL